MSTAAQPQAPSVATAYTPGIALCLSGGGYRAALFHLGALRRLNELGILPKLDMLASVSGGSILAGHLATYMKPWPSAGQPFADWQSAIEDKFLPLMRRNIRTWPVLKRFLLPWNWFRPSTQVFALEAEYHKYLTDLKLSHLPDKPKFVFCATDLVNGVLWVFEKGRIGSYAAGYLKTGDQWPMARAVAASSCFPPVFDPMPLQSGRFQVVDGLGKAMPAWTGMSVNDGGLYDNLGLQPAARFQTVLVSDGGAPFVADTPKGLFGRVHAYLTVMEKQAGSLRKSDLMDQYHAARQGAYWGVGSAVTRYDPSASAGYSKELAVKTIAQIRTDLDAFTDPEIAVLMNHGYLLADIAVKAHASHLTANAAPARIPFPDWMDENRVTQALRHSHERRLLGRS
jgi:NTE family protein